MRDWRGGGTKSRGIKKVGGSFKKKRLYAELTFTEVNFRGVNRGARGSHIPSGVLVVFDAPSRHFDDDEAVRRAAANERGTVCFPKKMNGGKWR